MIRPLPIGTGSNLDISDTSAGDSAAVSFMNAYVDRANAVRAVPGCAAYADTGINGETYGYYSVFHGVLLVFCNGQAWVQTEVNGALAALTGVSLTAGVPVAVAEDGSTIFFAADSVIHKCTPGNPAVSTIAALVNVTSLVYVGGYLMARADLAVGNVSGDTHYSDDKANGYAAWEVYNNESRPDSLQALVVAYEQIYNIGRETLEVSYIDGTVPFSVNKNAAQHFGTMSRYSVAFDGESIYYLSQVAESRKVIHLQGGGAPSIISFPIDIPLERFERVDDARGFIFSFEGQNGYAITFPTANAEIDETYYAAVTLFYHLQRKEWILLGKWNAEQGRYEAYRGVSFCYAEPWGLRLVGGRDGKLYKLVESGYAAGDYDSEYVILHRWRDNGNREWRIAKTVSTGKLGEYRSKPLRRGPNGSYYTRQHEIAYVDYSDAGDVFRAAIRTGTVSHGTKSKGKRSTLYHYNIERGKGRFVLNGIEEELDMLRH